MPKSSVVLSNPRSVGDSIKVAVTKGTLEVPPTYFAVQHARLLREQFDIRFFTGAARVTDDTVARELHIEDTSLRVLGLRTGSYRRRERFAPILAQSISRQVQRWQPDVIHQHFATLSEAAVHASARLHVPLILTVHGADVYVPLTPLPRHPIARAIHRHHQRSVARAFAQAATIFAVSEFLAEQVVRAGAPARHVDVLYQGVDTTTFSPGPTGSPSYPNVIFVGALSNSKGVRDLIAASDRIIRRRPHTVTVIGDGPLRDFLVEAARTRSYLRVLGQLPRDQVRDHLREATVFVLPTRQWKGRREAAGLVTLEAGACGVPVVVSDSGGASEMVRDGSTGFVVPERDVSALADSIECVLGMSAEKWQEMSTAAREFVLNERSLDVSAEILASRYREVAQ